MASSPCDLLISAAFDGGAIEVVDASDPSDVRLRLFREPFTQGTDKKRHSQFFYFRVDSTGPLGLPPAITFKLINAGDASYPVAWEGYQVAYTRDGEYWPRCPETTYDAKSGILQWTWRNTGPDAGPLFFAYFAPYTYERHVQLVAKSVASAYCVHRCLGHSLDGRPIDLLVAGTGPAKVWVNARQHPGETQAEWLMEGLLERLLDPNDPVAKRLRQLATFRMVPNMNPDGR